MEPGVQPAGATVAVLGPGGVGGLVGALLARAGHRVVFLARPDSVAALREHGLTVHSGIYGDFAVPVEAATELAEPVEACLVTVKATVLEPALASVPPDVLGDGLVLPLLNGVEHLTLLRGRYRAEQVVAGAIRVESTRVGPGRIEHTSPFAVIELASRTTPAQRVERLAGWLERAGLEVTVRDDETEMLWDKLAFLAPFALLTTQAGEPVGVVRSERREEAAAVVGEVARVARAAGATVEVGAIVRFLDGLPEGMKSSMQRDAEAGRAMELDAIGGAVLRTAKRHGIAVPLTEALVAELRARVEGPAPGIAGDPAPRHG
jgi:2-dehydropantoate 2-reductase